MTTKTLSKSDLAQFTGSENWYRHGFNRNVLYTDGAQHVAEHGGAYWLLDEIAIIQPYNKAVATEEFQVWKLAVRPDRTATYWEEHKREAMRKFEQIAEPPGVGQNLATETRRPLKNWIH